MDDEDRGAHGATSPGTDGTPARSGVAPACSGASGASSTPGAPGAPGVAGDAGSTQGAPLIAVAADGAVLLRRSSDGPPSSVPSLDLREASSTIADAALTGADGLEAEDLSRVLTGIDELRSALAALEMRTMSALDDAIRAQDAREGLPAKDRGRRTSGEIQMASRISPATASRRLRAGQRMTREMPRMFEALARGGMPAEAGFAIGRSAGPVEPELRGQIDEVLAEHLPDLDGSTPARWSQEVGALAQRIDPRGGPERHRRAARQRGVNVTPGAHGMGTVTAVLPGPDCAAIRRKLALAAESMQVQGDERTHGQLMADLFADTLLGRDETMDPVHFAINVVISERALFTPTHGEPAVVEGYGLIEATQVRDHVLDPRFPDRRTASGRPVAGSVHEQGVAPSVGRVHGAAPAGGAQATGGTVDGTSIGAGGEREDSAETLRRQTLGIIDIMRRSRGAPPLANGSPPPNGTATPLDSGGDAASGPPPRRAPSDPQRPSAPQRPAPEQMERDIARFEQQMGDSLRRVFTHPTTGELIAMDSRSRTFPEGLKLYMRLRDVSCVGPYCGAPIRHADHIRPVAEGGPTSAANGQGLCAHCNLTKEVLGRAEHTPSADGRHRVAWTSRLGATATVTPPSLAGLPFEPAGIGADGSIPVRGRRHLRLLVEGQDVAARDPYADLSPDEMDRMAAAAFARFGPDDEDADDRDPGEDRFVDESDVIEELDRLDALGRPDDDLGSLRGTA